MPYCPIGGKLRHWVAANTPDDTTTRNTPRNNNQMTLISATNDCNRRGTNEGDGLEDGDLLDRGGRGEAIAAKSSAVPGVGDRPSSRTGVGGKGTDKCFSHSCRTCSCDSKPNCCQFSNPRNSFSWLASELTLRSMVIRMAIAA